jgi:hypothetical protein
VSLIPPKSPAHDGPYIPCPPGLQQAVCCDVIDQGIVKGSWGGEERPQHKVRIRWQSKHRMKTGKPFLVQKQYTFSMHEKATLRKDINMWRGIALTEAQAENFDLERLIGVNAYLSVVHNKRKGKTYADVVALAPVPKNVARLVVDGYERKAATPTEPEAPEAGEPDPFVNDPEHGDAYEEPDEPEFS